MKVSSRSQHINGADSNRIYWSRSGIKPHTAASVPTQERWRTHLRRYMNFSSAARLASMVTDRKRGSTRRSTADRSAVSAASRTCEEFWSWFRRRTPSVPEVRIHRRRSEVATRSMTGDWNCGSRAPLPALLPCLQATLSSGVCPRWDGTSPAPGSDGRTGEPVSRAVSRHQQVINGRRYPRRSGWGPRYHPDLFTSLVHWTEKQHYCSLFFIFFYKPCYFFHFV